MVESALTDSSVVPLRVEEGFAPGAVWTNAVTDAIHQADLILADLSGKSPNVFYELGIAHALRKPTLLLVNTEAAQSLPSDLAGYNMLTYDPSDLSPLRRQLARALDHLGAGRRPTRDQ
jgi:nucleoside 2-deoxyribosyltransferase